MLRSRLRPAARRRWSDNTSSSHDHANLGRARLVKSGYRVSHVLDFPSRGHADKWSLGLLAEHGDAGSITLERKLVNGEVLDGAALKRSLPGLLAACARELTTQLPRTR
jgi:hypothetical protein